MSQNFDQFYEQSFPSRWNALKDALLQPNPLFERPNLFAEKDASVLKNYAMDPASVHPALALAVEPNQRVLDMCAAPGGKTLILLEALNGTGHLIANEISQQRRERLKWVLRHYVPEAIRQNIQVSGRDGSQWGLREKNSFDRVLLDAPCSGERHLLENPKELGKWSEARTRNLSRRQLSLLCSAMDATKPDGRLVYSTCALSPFENDQVIDNLHRKREGQFEVVPYQAPIGEGTKYGWRIWPDREGGAGPIYFCVLKKK